MVKYCWQRLLLGSWDYYKVTGSSSTNITLNFKFFINTSIDDFVTFLQVNHVGSLFHLATGKSMVESLPELTAPHIFDYVNSVQTALSNNSWPGIVIR